MENLNLIDTFAEFKELKNIDRPTMMSVLEDVFRNMLIKMYGSDDNYDIIINIDKGDFEIWRNREIVENGKVEDPNRQISLREAKKIDDDYEVGEEVTDEVKLIDFGRRAILALRQNLTSRILELENNNIYNKYKDRIGEIVTGEVYQVWKKEILILDDEGNELIIPKIEQIPTDYVRKGDTIRAVVIRVEMRNSSPLIILSRTSPVFLERLFELEVPEIFDGVVEIKSVSREAGSRTKMAVVSKNPDIDAVGACIGTKGARVNSIVDELGGEKIDIIEYSDDPQKYISAALSPAKVLSVEITDLENKNCRVTVPDGQLSLAIGNKGQNARLAARLTGWKIDIRPESGFFGEDEEDEKLEVAEDTTAEDTLELDDTAEENTEALDLDGEKTAEADVEADENTNEE